DFVISPTGTISSRLHREVANRRTHATRERPTGRRHKNRVRPIILNGYREPVRTADRCGVNRCGQCRQESNKCYTGAWFSEHLKVTFSTDSIRVYRKLRKLKLGSCALSESCSRSPRWTSLHR